MHKFLTSFFGIFLLTAPLAAQRQAAAPIVRKEAQALRIERDVIHVDGHLDEPDWEHAPTIQDFVQKEPNENAAPAERMEVKILYDDSALYIAARMYKNPGNPI